MKVESRGSKSIAYDAFYGRWDDVDRKILEGSFSDQNALSELLLELSFFGYLKGVECLVAKGADLNFLSNGYDPSGYALEAEAYVRGTPVAMTIIGAYEQSMSTSLVENRRFDTHPVLRVLLEAGADPNKHCYSGHTPFTLAVCHDQERHAETLLRHGADPDLQTLREASNQELFDCHAWVLPLLDQNGK